MPQAQENSQAGHMLIPRACQVLTLPLAVSTPWWLCLTWNHLYIHIGPAGQAEQASKCNGSATGRVQTKIRSKVTTRAFISQGKLWLQRKKGQELLWLNVSCILPTPVLWWQRHLQLHVGNTCCSVAGGTYTQERLWPPPFLTTLGLCLGLWHLQCTDCKVLCSGLNRVT